jgi:hypothetical protein
VDEFFSGQDWKFFKEKLELFFSGGPGSLLETDTPLPIPFLIPFLFLNLDQL